MDYTHYNNNAQGHKSHRHQSDRVQVDFGGNVWKTVRHRHCLGRFLSFKNKEEERKGESSGLAVG